MSRTVVRWLLVAVTLAGLAIDAYVHFDLAARYDPIASTTLSQGDLFRFEAVASIVAGVALLARPRWYTAGLALLVLAGGALALYVYRYWNVPAFGPIPRMYEPIWFGEKSLAAAAETIGALSAMALVVVERPVGRVLARAKAPEINPI